MAGGKGTRFWPISTVTKPKQFLPLLSTHTLLQETYERFRRWLPMANIYVATVQAYVRYVTEQLPALPLEQLIIEPEGRDTGPCTALTALYFLSKHQDEVLVMVPSDQYISDSEALWQALENASSEAARGKSTVMLGIQPTRPETGYGYIRTTKLEQHSSLLHVSSFIEKPDLDLANILCHSPNTYWNSGIFIWRPSTIAHLMGKYCPEIWNPLSINYPDIQTIYKDIPRLSIDYAVIEKADDLYVIPVQFDWDDVGTWNSVRRHHELNQDCNMLNGPIKVLDAQDNTIFSNKQTIIIGVQDLIVVSTEDGLLICHRSEEQRIKEAIHDEQSAQKLLPD